MSGDVEVEEAARERLFDVVLAEAVAAERASPPAPRGRQWALVAAVLLAVLVTIGVALLKAADSRDEAQDPKTFDPLFPRIEREFHFDRLCVQVRSLERVRQLPEGELPPLAALPRAPNEGLPVPVDIVDALAGRRGVRSLCVAGDSGMPVESWRRIAAMPDLEVLTICCDIDAACMRELRHAPRLRALGLEKAKFRISAELMAALLELPRLDSIALSWQELPPSALAALAGLPELRSLYLEKCSTDPGWLDALAQLRTLRWLFLALGPWKNGVLTAEDLRRIGTLPRLESLSLHAVDIAAADYAALPASLQMVSLHEPVPASVVRELLTRPKLRGLCLRCADPEAESTLCELLPTTKLERFGCDTGVSERLWDALGHLPRLRHLSFRARKDIAVDLQRVVGLKALEHVGFQASVPAAETLGCLRDLPQLRRVVISGVGDGTEYRADLVGLQQALGPKVDLIVH